MAKIRLDPKLWVLVCDAKKALLLQNAGDNIYPKLETRHVMEHDVHRFREIGSDVPGKAFARASDRRAAMDEGDPHLEEERRFLNVIVQDLEQRVENGEVDRLVIVAPPRALGILRSCENRRLKGATVAELPHDYIKMPLYEIEQRLKTAFA